MIGMARRLSFTAEEVLEFLIMVKGGDAGRGLSEGPSTGLLEALADDRARSSTRRSSRSPRRSSGTRARTLRLPEKKKRRVSAYQREFGRQLKRLKKAHPRTPVTRLMKRAHAATKRARRGK